MKVMKMVVVGGVLVFLALFVLQGVFFAVVMGRENDAEPSDAVVIYRGSELRVQEGYALAARGAAPHLILSPADQEMRRMYDRRYGLPPEVQHLPEEYGSHTLGNAYYTSRLIAEHDLQSITLVTADYHMPRSLLLLYLFAPGRDVEIRIHKVRADSAKADRTTLIKLVYNEMLKTWASLGQYAIWRVQGGDLDIKEDRPAWVQKVRNALLVRVGGAW